MGAINSGFSEIMAKLSRCENIYMKTHNSFSNYFYAGYLFEQVNTLHIKKKNHAIFNFLSRLDILTEPEPSWFD